MLRLGLTGGIASGKSAVAAMLREMGFAVLDADSLAHKLIEPGQPAYDEVVHDFGQAVLAAGGRVDRAKLSTVVFADRAKLDRLNAIVHPRVAEVIFSQFEVWRRAGVRDAVFVEAALLIERGLSEAEARRRIGAQLPVEEKLLLATEKIDCSGSLEETRRQVESLAAKLRRSQTAR